MWKTASVAIGIALCSLGYSAQARGAETAIFAGGCFWCVEYDFDQVPGVLETVSGFVGGTTVNPTYEQVSSGGTGHREAVRITYDPMVVTYEQLLDAYWTSVDPTDPGGQFCDRGTPYQSAIYVEDEAQRDIAIASLNEAQKSLGIPFATSIDLATAFYPAEDRHQDYSARNPVRYKYYRWRCGRDERVRELWGDEAYRGIPGAGLRPRIAQAVEIR